MKFQESLFFSPPTSCPELLGLAALSWPHLLPTSEIRIQTPSSLRMAPLLPAPEQMHLSAVSTGPCYQPAQSDVSDTTRDFPGALGLNPFFHHLVCLESLGPSSCHTQGAWVLSWLIKSCSSHPLFCCTQLHSHQRSLSFKDQGFFLHLDFSAHPTQSPELMFLCQTKLDFSYQAPIDLGKAWKGKEGKGYPAETPCAQLRPLPTSCQLYVSQLSVPVCLVSFCCGLFCSNLAQSDRFMLGVLTWPLFAGRQQLNHIDSYIFYCSMIQSSSGVVVEFIFSNRTTF